MKHTFVDEPGIEAITSSNRKDIVNKIDIDSALHHLYGFNLGFALEVSSQVIRENVVKLLLQKELLKTRLDEIRDCHIVANYKDVIVQRINAALSDDNLRQRAEKFSDYKSGVESRSQNSHFKE